VAGYLCGGNEPSGSVAVLPFKVGRRAVWHVPLTTTFSETKGNTALKTNNVAPAVGITVNYKLISKHLTFGQEPC
jgi:hypothetical protein